MGLAEFAAKDTARQGVPCWLCGIPERAEVEQAVADGVRKAVARRWLAAPKEDGGCGYGPAATVNRIEHHFREHVR